MEVLIFSILEFFIFTVFIIFISDIRKKEGMIPITNEILVRVMKLAYLIPLLIFGYNIYNLSQLYYTDYIGFIISTLGAYCVVRSKKDLGKQHTWTGYRFEKTSLVTHGIYSYVRHPLYLGIYLFAIGGLTILIPHANRLQSLIVILFLGYILTFLWRVAKLESIHLEREFGQEYKEYNRQVHPFLPIRKYNQN